MTLAVYSPPPPVRGRNAYLRCTIMRYFCERSSATLLVEVPPVLPNTNTDLASAIDATASPTSALLAVIWN